MTRRCRRIRCGTTTSAVATSAAGATAAGATAGGAAALLALLARGLVALRRLVLGLGLVAVLVSLTRGHFVVREIDHRVAVLELGQPVGHDVPPVLGGEDDLPFDHVVRVDVGVQVSPGVVRDGVDAREDDHVQAILGEGDLGVLRDHGAVVELLLDQGPVEPHSGHQLDLLDRRSASQRCGDGVDHRRHLAGISSHRLHPLGRIPFGIELERIGDVLLDLEARGVEHALGRSAGADATVTVQLIVDQQVGVVDEVVDRGRGPAGTLVGLAFGVERVVGLADTVGADLDVLDLLLDRGSGDRVGLGAERILCRLLGAGPGGESEVERESGEQRGGSEPDATSRLGVGLAHGALGHFVSTERAQDEDDGGDHHQRP